jgi:hypothetical protein
MRRGAGALTAAGGVVLAVRPDRVARAVGGSAPPTLVRLLGVRMLVQGAMLAARPDRRTAVACCAVDGTHAASMLGVAVVAPRYRRVALWAVGAATASAALDVLVARWPA